MKLEPLLNVCCRKPLEMAQLISKAAVNALRTQRLSNNADAFNGAFDPLFERNAITSVNGEPTHYAYRACIDTP